MDEIQYGRCGTKCKVANCDSYCIQRNSLSQFRFPQDEEICTQWVQRCGNFKLQENFEKYGIEWIRKYSRICSKHFISSDFRNPKLTSQGLKKGVVPSQHVFQPRTFVKIPQRTSRSTETNSNEEKNVALLTSYETKSSEEKLNDQQAPNSTNCNTSFRGQLLAVNPAVSASSGSNTTNDKSVRHSRRKDLLRKRQIFETSDDDLEVTPFSLVVEKKKSKNLGMPTVKNTELPDNLKTCAFLNCKSQNNRIPDLKFYPFPLNENRAKLWAVNCRRPDLLDIDSQRLHIDYVLCSLHFKEHDVCDNLTSSIKQNVSNTSIPTLFDSNEKPKTSTSSSYSSKIMLASSIQEECSYANIVSQMTALDEFLNEISSSSDEQDISCELVYADEIVSHPTFVPFKHTKATQTDPPWVINAVIEDRSTSGLCRLCAKSVHKTHLVHIFKQLSTSKEYLRIMNRFLPDTEQVAENDSLPQWVCYNCCGILEYCKKAEQSFLDANRKLKELSAIAVPVRSTKVQIPGIPSKKNMPNSKSTKPGSEDFDNSEVITESNSSIKRVVTQDDYDELDQYDSSSEQSESVGKKERKRVQEVCCSMSATSAKLIRTESVSQVFDEEDSRITNNKLSSSNTRRYRQKKNKAKKCQETGIQNSHTTIRLTQDRKTFLCERCDMSFESIEKALTHRFKDHSHAEFSKQVKK